MRLIWTTKDEKKARTFSKFLDNEEINHEVDISKNTDWGSEHYGDISFSIWIVSEDSFAKSLEYLKEFEQDPNNARFVTPTLKAHPVPQKAPQPQITQPPIGKMTLYFLVTCILLFVLGTLTTPVASPERVSLPGSALYASPVKRALMFDFPKAYQIASTLTKNYSLEQLQNPAQLPTKGQNLIQELNRTPHWNGFYEKVVLTLQNPGTPVKVTAPMFEKIRKGEVWRLFTPCLLHAGIFHIVFNMLWLVVLGRQIEDRIGMGRYLILIIISAIVSNTAQYLMSGPNFLGFSGVLCAMFAFIWVRQKNAAWEGYQVHPSTFSFIALFILGMFGLQLAAFFYEVSTQTPSSFGIANTAHLSGAAAGYLLGRLNAFSRNFR